MSQVCRNFVLHAMSLALLLMSLEGASHFDSKVFAFVAGISVWPICMTGFDVFNSLRSLRN
ncbi:hypothetical protein AYO08_10645 [Pseudomonas putida]|nr:hypothetical protein AYO08_10645 [Pseudomonas putida]